MSKWIKYNLTKFCTCNQLYASQCGFDFGSNKSRT